MFQPPPKDGLPTTPPQTQDGQDLVELWYPHMDLYFTTCLSDPKLPRVAAHILEVSPSGLYFMDVLLGYLLDARLGSLRLPDSPVRALGGGMCVWMVVFV